MIVAGISSPSFIDEIINKIRSEESFTAVTQGNSIRELRDAIRDASPQDLLKAALEQGLISVNASLPHNDTSTAMTADVIAKVIIAGLTVKPGSNASTTAPAFLGKHAYRT
jgi:hypothetical protein